MYWRRSVADDQLFVADAKAKALQGDNVVDVHAEEGGPVVTYELATTGPSA